MTHQQRIQKIKTAIRLHGKNTAACMLIKKLYDKSITQQQEKIYINFLDQLGYIEESKQGKLI